MYHAHFGLERGLFGEAIAADTAVFRGAKHDRLIAHFKLALASPSSVIVLHGAAGVGKTTLTSAALRAIGTRLALAWVGGMATNSAELLELILVELGISTLRTTRIERVQLWRQFQGEMRATDSRLIIVVERTEDLSPEVLHALDQLTAPDAAGNPAANLVLLGNAGIHEHLSAPVLDSLRQRIRLRVELEPLTEAELQEYLRHQVVAAGGSFDRVFAPGAVTALHRYSQGVARLVNTLCESALDIAAVQQQKQLTPELVAKTATTLLGLAEPAPPAQSAAALPRTPAPAPAPVVEAAAAPRPSTVTGPIFERRAVPRMPPTPASALPAEVPKTPPPPSPAVSAAAVAAAPPEPPLEIDFDGGITDVADVALADFPVLTDAIEPDEAEPAAPTPAKVTAPAPQPAAKVAPPVTAAPAAPAPPKPAPPAAAAAKVAPPPTAPAPAAPSPPKAAPPATTAPAAAKPAPKPAPRVEAPASVTRPPPKPTPPAPTTTPLPHVAKAAAAATAPPKDAEKPQAGRGIAEAKSIADLSDMDAETLFADAELDLVSAALASAADWPDDDELAAPKAAPRPATAAAAPRPAAAKPATPAAPPAKPAAPAPKAAAPAPKPATPAPKAAAPAAKPAAESEEPFDLFGLDDNAPLELIDDSTLPPANPRPKTAVR